MPFGKLPAFPTHGEGFPTYVFNLRQYRIIQVCGLRSKIFRQIVQINRGKAVALPRFFGQADGIRFKQAGRLELCGVALNIRFSVHNLYDTTIAITP